MFGRRWTPALFLAVILFLTSLADASLRDLVRRVPERANAIVVLNMSKIMSSPLAVKEDWRAQQENAFAAGLIMVPPSATEFLMAAHMDFETMHPLWEVSLAAVDYEPTMAKIAAEYGGQIDQFGTRTAAVLPDDTYVVKFGPKMVGVRRPANRQNVARWLRQIDAGGNSNTRLSPYLTQAVHYAEDVGTPIIMAMDFQDVLAPDMVRVRLEEFVKQHNVQMDLDKLSEAIASLKGVTLGITIKDKVFGKIKVEFDKDISSLGPLAKPLLLQVLANNGAMIHEFDDWTAKVSKNQFSIEGDLYQSGMQRILSILDAPASLQRHHGGSSVQDPAAKEESLKALSSQQYFKSVTTLVNDLQHKKGGKTLGQFAMWYGRYADKINKLPILNVDPALLDYGSSTASSLRDAQAALRGAASQTRVREVNAPPQYRYYARYGYNVGWGWGGVAGYTSQEDRQAESAERARIRTEERIGGAKQVQDIMQEVAESTANIRRDMTEKYKVEF